MHSIKHGPKKNHLNNQPITLSIYFVRNYRNVTPSLFSLPSNLQVPHGQYLTGITVETKLQQQLSKRRNRHCTMAAKAKSSAMIRKNAGCCIVYFYVDYLHYKRQFKV